MPGIGDFGDRTIERAREAALRARRRRLSDPPDSRPALPPDHGRRATDPADRPPEPDALAVRGRLAGISVRASMAAGAWVGFALGLTVGAGAGAILVWFAGAIIDWQRDLSFTLGVTQRLLPFGDQLGLLRSIESRWYVVIPAAGLVIGIAAAVIGAFIGGLIAVTYNRSPRHALVIVDLPREPVVGRASRETMADGEPVQRAALGTPPVAVGEPPAVDERPGVDAGPG